MPAKPNPAWAFVATKCDENPGTWFRVGENMNSAYVNHIRTARLIAFSPPGTYTGMIRGGDSRTGTLYVRRNPEDEQ